METASTSKDISQLLTERGATHGSFHDNASVSQALKHILQTCPNWDRLPVVHREALEMICLKIARAVTGDHMVADHYDDIAGYAKLISARCAQNDL